MNHPRRVRLRRLLLLVPLALLGAALLVRVRLPRPQTDSDKWLWEQAETAPFISVSFGNAGRSLLKRLGIDSHAQFTVMQISARQGIRDVLRSLQGTPAFQIQSKREIHGTNDLPRASVVATITIRGSHPTTLWLTQEPVGYCLYRNNAQEVAPISQQEFAAFESGLRRIVEKAGPPDSDYTIVSGSV